MQPSELIAVGRRHGGLDVSERDLVFGGLTEHFLDLACAEPSLWEVFDELAASVLAAADGASWPVSEAVAVLDRWHDLLNARLAESLAHRRELSVVAELLVLDRLSEIRRFDPRVWRGPLHEPQDFVLMRHWIEVKAAGATSESVTIHGLEQLDGGPLPGYLCVVTLIEDDAGPHTWRSLADELRPRATDTAEFDRRLSLATGDRTAEPRRWTLDGFILTPSSSCPRLIGSSLHDPLPAGLGRLQYTIELDVLRGRSLADGEAELRHLGDDL
jgi:hypothetical protein